MKLITKKGKTIVYDNNNSIVIIAKNSRLCREYAKERKRDDSRKSRQVENTSEIYDVSNDSNVMESS